MTVCLLFAVKPKKKERGKDVQGTLDRIKAIAAAKKKREAGSLAPLALAGPGVQPTGAGWAPGEAAADNAAVLAVKSLNSAAALQKMVCRATVAAG
jgi:hypothetical protein